MGSTDPARRHAVGTQHRLRRWWQGGGQHQLEHRRAPELVDQRRPRPVAGLRRLAPEVRQQRRPDRHAGQRCQPLARGQCHHSEPERHRHHHPPGSAAARGLHRLPALRARPAGTEPPGPLCIRHLADHADPHHEQQPGAFAAADPGRTRRPADAVERRVPPHRRGQQLRRRRP